jgi:two-component system KDP operon response regulator KdpE
MLLEISGYSVDTAGTGAAALRAVAQRQPAVVVLDLALPDLPGVEVARRLRSAATTAHVPLIALTGRAMTSEAEDELGRVFDAIIIKPCEPKHLIAQIEKLVAASKPARETTT